MKTNNIKPRGRRNTSGRRGRPYCKNLIATAELMVSAPGIGPKAIASKLSIAHESARTLVKRVRKIGAANITATSQKKELLGAGAGMDVPVLHLQPTALTPHNPHPSVNTCTIVNPPPAFDEFFNIVKNGPYVRD